MNASLGNPDKDGLYFSVTTMVIDDNRSLKKPPIDKDGYYTDVPAAVIGTVSRNNTCYDAPSFIQQLKGPSNFSKRVMEGVAASEYGHPFIANPNSSEGIARLLHIEPTRISNHIRSVSVRHIDDLDIDMVFMDTKPAGPYGKYFEESMEDPTRNTAFSLRGLSKAHQDPRTHVIHKSLFAFVTFDSGVVGSGFKETTKRYIAGARESLGVDENQNISCESIDTYDISVNADDLAVLRTQSLETISDSELNDIIKAKRIIIGKTEIGIISRDSSMLIDNEGKKRHIFTSFLSVNGR